MKRYKPLFNKLNEDTKFRNKFFKFVKISEDKLFRFTLEIYKKHFDFYLNDFEKAIKKFKLFETNIEYNIQALSAICKKIIVDLEPTFRYLKYLAEDISKSEVEYKKNQYEKLLLKIKSAKLLFKDYSNRLEKDIEIIERDKIFDKEIIQKVEVKKINLENNYDDAKKIYNSIKNYLDKI